MSTKKLKVHFIGIGGIGVSALARYYLENGYKVSGSDLVASEITNGLKKLGTKIIIGKHKAGNLPKNIDLVVYSPAVQSNNPEFQRAKKLKIKILSYPEALGELTKKYLTIAISGTHGKSTTTAMIGLLLVKAGFDPTVIIGTKLKEFGDSTHSTSSGLTLSNIEGSNYRVGKSQYLVIEADEHMASFLNYWPKIIVLTNIEADHLDYYKNIGNIKKAFDEFISHLPKDGILITHKSIDKKALPKLKKILKLPGAHNIYNASLALAVARALKIPDKVSFKALSDYKGSWRRFEEKNLTFNNKQLTIISDYGHHPTQVRVTLEATREKFSKNIIWCVYQPHQYQRTYYLFKNFVKVFKMAATQKWIDKLIITDIYDVAGRENKKIKKKVSSQKLVKTINKSRVMYLPNEKILEYLRQNLKGREVVIIMGAGDIYNLTLRLTGLNKNHY